MFRIAYESMLDDLDLKARKFWLALCEGRTAREIETAGIVPRNRQAQVKREIRKAFRKHFGK